MKQFTARAYNNFKIDRLKDIVHKSSSTERLCDEINYYQRIHKTEFSCFFPRLFNHSLGEINSLSLEYYPFDNLYQLERGWEDVAEKLNCVLYFLHSAKHPSLSDAEVIHYKREMYIDKTLHYQKELVDNFDFFRFLEKKNKVTINGESVYTFSSIWPMVEELITSTLLSSAEFSVIHGDLCFSNILFHKNTIKFIDPRGSFGMKGIYGDPLYDVAKLLHSFSGCYEAIIYDQFSLENNNSQINFRLEDKQLKEAAKVFSDLERFNNPKAKLIEGLIFIGMCSRHYDSPKRQRVMYARGLKILNDLIK
jgi:hypothetical protein